LEDAGEGTLRSGATADVGGGVEDKVLVVGSWGNPALLFP
jgi:hypothetical protein